MKNNIFWNDVLRGGAILGIIMCLSTIFENYVMYYSSMPMMTAAITYLVEWIVVVGIYIWLIYHYTKNYANKFDVRTGFDFGLGFGFVVTLTLLVAIMVGMTNTIFYSIMGFDGFVDGYLSRLDELSLYLQTHGVPMESIQDDMTKLRDNVATLEQPSMLSSILGTISNYVFIGVFIGVIVAFVVRRRPIFIDNE